MIKGTDVIFFYVFEKSIRLRREHLKFKIDKERLWNLCVFPYGLHFPVLLEEVKIRVLPCHIPYNVHGATQSYSFLDYFPKMKVGLSNHQPVYVCKMKVGLSNHQPVYVCVSVCTLFTFEPKSGFP
jgi:hypothetical protein